MIWPLQHTYQVFEAVDSRDFERIIRILFSEFVKMINIYKKITI